MSSKQTTKNLYDYSVIGHQLGIFAVCGVLGLYPKNISEGGAFDILTQSVIRVISSLGINKYYPFPRTTKEQKHNLVRQKMKRHLGEAAESREYKLIANASRSEDLCYSSGVEEGTNFFQTSVTKKVLSLFIMMYIPMLPFLALINNSI
ncbi:uncharacterized protein LOC111085999 [Limulus polyphemus]|uniref:Uncharacterized protein LOC111085999 n=1 Tax=Limulus polyphemus TaxID=6850 RepID=A0ABM1SGX2_LIMPO|nr:uncharacterized protein LOC111085999 [Limulus polyphemus]